MLRVWNNVYADAKENRTALAWELENIERGKPTIIKHLLRYLDVGRIGLELACGRGQNIKYLINKGKEMYGSDISSVAVAQSGLKNVICAESTDTPFETGFFDFIIDIGGFHHIERKNRSKYITEVCRLLKTHGYFAFSCFDTLDPYNTANKWAVSKYGLYVNFSTLAELRTLFEKKFKIKEVIKITWPSTKNRDHSAIGMICQTKS